MLSSTRGLLVFSEAARQRSFAAAGRELGLSPSAVVKGVARLEQDLGVRLFHRTTRKLSLTSEGEVLFERCQHILAQLADLRETAGGVGKGPTGVLRIDVPISYGKQVLLPAAARLVQKYPALGLDIRLSDKFNDVIEAGLDAVVRAGGKGDSRLVSRVIDHETLGIYASPQYLQRRGSPGSPDDLRDHDCIGYRQPTTNQVREWQFRVAGKAVTLPCNGRYLINEGEGLAVAATSGLGLIQVPRYMAKAAVDAGDLEEVLQPFEPASIPITILFASRRQVPQRLRLFIQTLTNPSP